MKTLEIKIKYKTSESDSILSLLMSKDFEILKHGIEVSGKGFSYTIHDDELTIDYITETVCKFFNIPKEVIFLKTKKREYVQARQIAAKLSYELIVPKLILRVVGDYFKQDHATVLHACKSIQNQIDTDKEFAKRYDAIRENLLN